jgi:hypothetical protein
MAKSFYIVRLWAPDGRKRRKGDAFLTSLAFGPPMAKKGEKRRKGETYRGQAALSISPYVSSQTTRRSVLSDEQQPAPKAGTRSAPGCPMISS